MPDVSYVPGALIAVAGDRCRALVDASPDSAVTTWIWQRIARGTSAEELLAGLLGDGFEGVGGFALLADLAAGQRRLFCRGTLAATVEGGNISARIDGVGLLTWREYVVASEAERIVLGEPPDSRVLRLPAAAGVLLASCVIIDLTSAASRETIPYDSPAGNYPATVATIRVIAPPKIADADRVTDPGRVTDAGRALDPGRGTDPGRVMDVGRASVPDIPASPNPVSSPSAPPRPPGGLIDAVAWGAGPAAAADPSAAGPGETDFTVKRPAPATPTPDPPAPGEVAEIEAEDGWAAEGRAEETVRPWTQPHRIGPLVPVLICPVGHLNPPSDADCRQCGAPLPNDAVVAPRPVLGVLRLSTGGVVALDRGVVMGRDPRTDFVGFDGDERPQVVRLPSADGDISRTHVRVTLDGWHVLVTDLNSTNGTLVALPGRDSERLRPGEPVPIKPGTVVTLADGIDFRYEAAE
jgi:FHA domain